MPFNSSPEFPRNFTVSVISVNSRGDTADIKGDVGYRASLILGFPNSG